MTPKQQQNISRFLSLILRHKPETIHLNLDKNGYVNINLLLLHLKEYGNIDITFEELKSIVDSNDKSRFFISADNKLIRASQGHSVTDIDLQLEPVKPPSVLFHGTSLTNVLSIKQSGILKGNRQHVHLSTDIDIAINVGKRHGEPKALIIDTKKMFKDGYQFFLSENISSKKYINSQLITHI